MNKITSTTNTSAEVDLRKTGFLTLACMLPVMGASVAAIGLMAAGSEHDAMRAATAAGALSFLGALGAVRIKG